MSSIFLGGVYIALLLMNITFTLNGQEGDSGYRMSSIFLGGVYIALLLMIERTILHFQKRYEYYIENDVWDKGDLFDKIVNFLFRLFCSALITPVFLILSKICIDYFM